MLYCFGGEETIAQSGRHIIAAFMRVLWVAFYLSGAGGSHVSCAPILSGMYGDSVTGVSTLFIKILTGRCGSIKRSFL